MISISRPVAEQSWIRIASLFSRRAAPARFFLLQDCHSDTVSPAQLQRHNTLAISRDDEVKGGAILPNIDYWNRNAQIFLELAGLDDDDELAEIGSWMKRFFFLEMNLHRVFWLADAAAVANMIKLGASKEGYLIASHPDGLKQEYPILGMSCTQGTSEVFPT